MTFISCSKEVQRKPAVESEICIDYTNNTIICKNNNKCYITNVSNTQNTPISCKEFKQ